VVDGVGSRIHVGSETERVDRGPAGIDTINTMRRSASRSHSLVRQRNGLTLSEFIFGLALCVAVVLFVTADHWAEDEDAIFAFGFAMMAIVLMAIVVNYGIVAFVTIRSGRLFRSPHHLQKIIEDEATKGTSSVGRHDIDNFRFDHDGKIVEPGTFSPMNRQTTTEYSDLAETNLNRLR